MMNSYVTRLTKIKETKLIEKNRAIDNALCMNFLYYLYYVKSNGLLNSKWVYENARSRFELKAYLPRLTLLEMCESKDVEIGRKYNSWVFDTIGGVSVRVNT